MTEGAANGKPTQAAIDAAVQVLTKLVADAEHIRHMRLLIVLTDTKVRYEVTKQFPNSALNPPPKGAKIA